MNFYLHNTFGGPVYILSNTSEQLNANKNVTDTSILPNGSHYQISGHQCHNWQLTLARTENESYIKHDIANPM
jgi:hypothetical protein